MNILLLGSGGREHAFAWKISQSPLCKKLYIAPGNVGTAQCGENLNLKTDDFEGIKKHCIENKINLVIPAGEDPLVKGIYDYFQNDEALKNIPVIGPSQQGAMLEGSKAYAKQFMIRHGIPTANYREFNISNFNEGITYLQNHALPIVLKADGLAAGKGVVICDNHADAIREFEEMIKAQKFGNAGAKVVVEQFLKGIELSVFVITDGKNYQLLPTAKDYKRVGEGDTGLNTGGMGAVSPVPFADAALMKTIEATIIQPTMVGLQNDKIVYKGFIYFGLIKVEGKPFVIEYNCRMGDPETEVVLPRIKTDLVEIFNAVAVEKIDLQKIETDERAAVTIVLVSSGYPGSFETGKVIHGLETAQNSIIFHAGTSRNGDEIKTNGGRVLMLTSYGNTIEDALKNATTRAAKVSFDGMFYRSDIGLDLI